MSPVFNFTYDMDDYKAKFWPQLDLNLYWNYGKKIPGGKFAEH